ncbi:MAG TPA: ABC transporter permease [Candidatus Limnocylindria bacterium]|nr:ABC transporter permease [Candidatus Limnocylindria bacterium]
MGQYILRRLALMIPVAFLVTIIVFTLVRLTPGDPVLVYAGEERDPETLEQLRHEYGLDQPMPLQYVSWLTHAVQGDLGRSIRTRQPVTEAIFERLPATMELGLAALLISVTIALVVGTLSAVKRNSPLDLLATGFTLAGVSLPNFFLGLILILVFALALRLLPPGGYTPLKDDVLDNLEHLILPAITLATASLAVNMRQVRSSMLEVLSQEYMRTARAKGLRERTLILRHAFKNALIPVVTIVGLQVGAIIEGAVITEQVYFWPGVGKLVVDSIAGRDYPVVQGVVLVSAFSFMLSTLIVDVLYGVLDPRISYGSRGG